MRTRIATTRADDILIRGRNLAKDLMGEVGYTDMLVLTALGRLPSTAEKRIVEAIAVSVMDHGLTPSSLAARLTFLGAPESFQAAVAAGLLGAGNTFLGGMTGVTTLLRASAADLDEAASNSEVAQAADDLVTSRLMDGRKIPGLGHNVHTGSDPRVDRMRAIVRAEGYYELHWRLLDALPDAFARQKHRTLPLNNAGAIGASIAALGFPAEMGRGIALAARAGGLIAHLLEEQTEPIAKQVWEHVLNEADNSEDEDANLG
ncbi:citryl-CoA lyase [Mycobacterium sp. 236(2023)]|uniref:citryl-CoA lyase n=1 Tax=Mycobacterium sp. 236(2023) TaxID=3038163 RepID=UPI0024152EBA|nr:citryl-CoA lyase [Mycobacterium sp. 236(2023)]MDG4668112.1 citryl-CoA lyase [Mycobacterium sp. 236(2023)]